jgi:hypothetical protein
MTKISRKDADASREKNLAWMKGEMAAFPTGVSILDAIRRKCLDCAGFQPGEVAQCPIIRCALWPYRLGRNPFHARASEGAVAVEREGLEPPLAEAEP